MMDEPVEITPIRVDLQQQGYLGLNEELRCLGFFPRIELSGEIKSIDYYYAICVQGLDKTDENGNIIKGEITQTQSFVLSYTDDNLRPDEDENGNILYDTVDDTDENGNIIGTKQAMRMIGVVKFWMKKLGKQHIIPDLQFTLGQIGIKHRKITPKTKAANTLFIEALNGWVKPL